MSEPLPAGAARPAPTADRVRAQGRFETLTLLRNGEQLLVSIVLPAMALVGLVLAPYPDLGADRRVDVVTPGVLGLAVVSTAFTGQAISTAFDRRYGVLRLLGATPLGRGGLLAGKAVAVLAVLAVQVVVLGALGAVLGWRPEPAGIPPALLSLVLGSGTFVALALLLAGTVRAEAVLALANLVWVLLLGLGLAVPTDRLPGPLGGVAAALPSGALGDALRTSLGSGGWPWAQWAVLLLWGAVAAVAATRLFRWSP
ncbi:MAG TPA: ABC transporter permease [Dermatophilaceae bacterium]|nr:ABC transporter permease [Dermatophilaceae bacterium]